MNDLSIIEKELYAGRFERVAHLNDARQTGWLQQWESDGKVRVPDYLRDGSDLSALRLWLHQMSATLQRQTEAERRTTDMAIAKRKAERAERGMTDLIAQEIADWNDPYAESRPGGPDHYGY